MPVYPFLTFSNTEFVVQYAENINFQTTFSKCLVYAYRTFDTAYLLVYMVPIGHTKTSGRARIVFV